MTVIKRGLNGKKALMYESGGTERKEWKCFDDFQACAYNAPGDSRVEIVSDVSTIRNYSMGSPLPVVFERPSSSADYSKWCDR